MTAGQRRPLWRRRRILIAAALTAALAGAAEAGSRMWLENALNGATASMLGGHASVGIGARPALIDLAAGSVPTLTVHATGVNVCKVQGATIDATFHDAQRQNGRLTVASSQASILLPPAAIATLLDARLGAGMTATVIPDPAAGQLDVRIGGLFDLYEQPGLKNGTLTFTPASVGIGGFAAPAGIAGGLTTKAAFSQRLPALPLAMHAQTVTVTADGVLLDAAGSASGPQPAAKATAPTGGLRSC
jgi:hypothetical protein